MPIKNTVCIKKKCNYFQFFSLNYFNITAVHEDLLGVHIYRSDDLTLSTGIGYEDGRKESDDRANLSIEYDLDVIDPYVEIVKHPGGTAAQSGLAQYTVESGFKSVDAEIGLMYPVTKHWAVNTQLEYSRMIGDAADSPIVKD